MNATTTLAEIEAVLKGRGTPYNADDLAGFLGGDLAGRTAAEWADVWALRRSGQLCDLLLCAIQRIRQTAVNADDSEAVAALNAIRRECDWAEERLLGNTSGRSIGVPE